MIKFSVIIPTLNAEHHINRLLDCIDKQSLLPNRLIVVDSSSDDNTIKLVERHKGIIVSIIERNEFNHGRTRNDTVLNEDSDFIFFMTQDALPVDNYLFEKLLKPFSLDDKIAVSYARQIPYNNASAYEKAIREYNYPSKSLIKDIRSISDLGIKTFFCSNVCAAYKRDIFIQQNCFIDDIRISEDMFYAAKVINNGYKVAYVSDAMVYHSHSFTIRQQYKRYFDLGYELEKNKYLISNCSESVEGKKMFKYVAKSLIDSKHHFSLPAFIIDCFVRLLGNRNGRKCYKDTIN